MTMMDGGDSREEDPFDFASVKVTESTEEIVTPEPQGIDVEPEPDKPLTPLERVQRAMSRDGGRPDMPSVGASGPRPTSRDKADKKPPPKPREGTLVKPLTDMYTTIGLAISAVDPVCGTAIVSNAGDCARTMEKLARENEAVRRVITRLLETSAWGGVMIAHLPILAAVMMHHGPKSVQEKAAPITAFLNPDLMGTLNQDATPEGKTDAA